MPKNDPNENQPVLSTRIDPFRVGDWEAHPIDNHLRRQESSERIEVRIEPKAMQLLSLFASRSGETIDKREIFDALWKDRVVTDDVLTTTVSSLRRAMGDRARSPRFIQTIPGIGYRLIAPVEPIVSNAAPVVVDEPPPQTQDPQSPKRLHQQTTIRVGALSLVLILVLVLGASLWNQDQTGPSNPIEVLAVLPFEIQSSVSSEREWMKGFASILTNEVAQTSTCRVLVYGASTSRDSTPMADAVIEGTLRANEEGGAISVRLRDTRDSSVLWSSNDSFTRMELPAIPRRLAREIAIAVRGSSTSTAFAEQVRSSSPNAEAFRLYLEARYRLGLPGLSEAKEALDLLNRALETQPDYGDALVESARAWMRLAEGDVPPREAMQRARELCLRALAVEPSSGALCGLGQIQFLLDWDFDEARASLDRALVLNPNNSDVYAVLSTMATIQGRYEEALALMSHHERLDPGSYPNPSRAWILMAQRRYVEAIADLEDLHRVARDDWNTMFFLMKAYACVGRDEESFDLHRALLIRSGASDHTLSEMEDHFADGGLEAIHQWHLQRLEDRRDDGGLVSSAELAEAHALLGHDEKALDCLEEALDRREARLLFVRQETAFHGLDQNPRFVALLEKAGL